MVLFLLAAAMAAALVIGPELEKRTYRLEYPALIEAESAAFLLDPYLVSAIIHCESGNRPKVISGSGAIGLMQIMPDTGEWIAKKLNVEGYTVDMLYQPEINVKFGCWYLRFLLDRFSGDLELAIAAYNAGQGTVDKWMNDEAIFRDGRLVDIPFPETANYIVKVQRAYEKYKQLYKNTF